ncbi:hypothetical protein [Limnochorda pilosa]|uniref:Fucose isomerase n=1 Tax=Limnochorda pilosa TaxID=1555112 RepID=A0A0K2SGX8_LIMPI|nr:hypothetical protein [Limnochorda pilosa]BAS26282.1 fucose isomerase [Limnochorda pilosa]
MKRIGLLSIARATFDVGAIVSDRRSLARLLEDPREGAGSPIEVVQVDRPITQPDDVPQAIRVLREADGQGGARIDALVVHQGTFADASVLLALVQAFRSPVILWAVPEPVSETGRLRLNSFCGANLAANTLHRIGHPYTAVYGGATTATAHEIMQRARAFAAVERVRRASVLVLGEAPTGFFPSQLDPLHVAARFGSKVRHVPLKVLFDRANGLPQERVETVFHEEAATLRGINEVPQVQANQSIRAQIAIQDACEEVGADAVAVECWPDFMVQFGGAACWSMSRLIDRGIMAGCEADVYGALTMMMQHEITGEASFFADLVEVKREENTGTFWHCGAAPLSLGNPEEIRASRQPNRQVALTLDFGLRPGRVTVAKLYRGREGEALFITTGTALARPVQYRGNTMVVQFDRDAGELLDLIFDEGLEHHYSVAYGDMRRELTLVARELQLPVMEG